MTEASGLRLTVDNLSRCRAGHRINKLGSKSALRYLWRSTLGATRLQVDSAFRMPGRSSDLVPERYRRLHTGRPYRGLP